ncbi:MAG: hypothetical protein ACXADW_23380, partial [Candidatus Hodarchaeales archaeon]
MAHWDLSSLRPSETGSMRNYTCHTMPNLCLEITLILPYSDGISGYSSQSPSLLRLNAVIPIAHTPTITNENPIIKIHSILSST